MSHQQLLDIIRAAADEQAWWRAQPARACPYDGTPLLTSPPGADSEKYCPMGDFYYPQDWDATTMAGM